MPLFYTSENLQNEVCTILTPIPITSKRIREILMEKRRIDISMYSIHNALQELLS